MNYDLRIMNRSCDFYKLSQALCKVTCRVLKAYGRLTTEGWLGEQCVKVGRMLSLPRPKITIQVNKS